MRRYLSPVVVLYALSSLLLVIATVSKWEKASFFVGLIAAIAGIWFVVVLIIGFFTERRRRLWKERQIEFPDEWFAVYEAGPQHLLVRIIWEIPESHSWWKHSESVVVHGIEIPMTQLQSRRSGGRRITLDLQADAALLPMSTEQATVEITVTLDDGTKNTEKRHLSIRNWPTPLSTPGTAENQTVGV